MAVARQRMTVSEASKPALPRHVKLRFDETRQRWIMLAPERVLVPDETAVEVLQLCDGERTLAQVVDVLAAKYAADRDAITGDVIALLADLAEKGFLVEAQSTSSWLQVPPRYRNLLAIRWML